MTVALLAGLVAGAGLWVTLAGWRPRPSPLAAVLADLSRPATRPGDDTPGRIGRWMVATVAAVTGGRSAHRDVQLAVAGRTAQDWARDKIVGATVGLAVPLAVWAALATVGIALPPVVAGLGLLGAVAGWVLVDMRLTEQVQQRRKAFTYALSAYLDLVNVILAGGGGIETALLAAAEAGDGWAFARLRHALDGAQRINQPLWTAFDDLGTELGIVELRDLASSLGLAGTQGARVRASLAVKADTLRARQISQTEAAAEATTERMNLPTAVLLLGFLVFIVYPAVTAITATTTTTDVTCIAGQPAGDNCPPPPVD
jgi:Flp pilus assembly protein TadB